MTAIAMRRQNHERSFRTPLSLTDRLFNKNKVCQLLRRLPDYCLGSININLSKDLISNQVETDTLRLYGVAALDGLDKNNTVSNVAAISHIYFKFIPFDSIIPHFPKLRVR